MKKSLRSYIRTERKRWALSQKTLAFLLGFKNCTHLSKYERHRRLPNLRTALACHVIFGIPLQQLFKGLYEEIEEDVMQRAARLHDRVQHRTDAEGLRRRKLLEEMVARSRKSK